MTNELPESEYFDSDGDFSDCFSCRDFFTDSILNLFRDADQIDETRLQEKIDYFKTKFRNSLIGFLLTDKINTELFSMSNIKPNN